MNQLTGFPMMLRNSLSSTCVTCSVSSTEELLYLQLVSEPSVASRNRKRMRDEAHSISSQLVRDSRNVLWLCRSWNRTKATWFTLFVLVKKRMSHISFIWSLRPFFTQAISSETGLLNLCSPSRSDVTDLGTNDEWNGEGQQEDSRDDDVHGALRASPLQWTQHCNKNNSVTTLQWWNRLQEPSDCYSSGIQTLRKERSDSHIFMFCTFFSLKWGISDFLALRAEVRWLKYLANKSLCWGINMSIYCQRSKAFDRIQQPWKRNQMWDSVSLRCLY